VALARLSSLYIFKPRQDSAPAGGSENSPARSSGREKLTSTSKCRVISEQHVPVPSGTAEVSRRPAPVRDDREMTKSLLARPANAPSPSWRLHSSLTGLNLLVDSTCTRHSAVPGYSQPRLSALNFGLRENSGETWRCRVSTAMVFAISTATVFCRTTRVGRIRP
jgi:hypothetical protein